MVDNIQLHPNHIGTNGNSFQGNTQSRLWGSKDVDHIYRLSYSCQRLIAMLTENAIASLNWVNRYHPVTRIEQGLHT